MALWKARYCYIKIGQAISNPGSSSSDFWTLIDAQTTPAEQDIEKITKNVTFKEPERNSEVVLLLGSTTGNQNAELNETSSDQAEFSGTLMLTPESTNKFDLFKRRFTVHTTIASSWDTRYNYAAAAPSTGVAVAIQFTDGTNKMNFLLNNAVVTTVGGFKLEADGSAEQEIKVTCAPNDCWVEENFSLG